MRLSTDQIQAIRQAANATFGAGTAVWLFGSRADDSKKGGDIDLLVRPSIATAHQPFAKKIKMLGLRKPAAQAHPDRAKDACIQPGCSHKAPPPSARWASQTLCCTT